MTNLERVRANLAKLQELLDRLEMILKEIQPVTLGKIT